jgi:transglutaminase-like putative cysteine protease
MERPIFHPSNREQMIMQQTDSRYLNPTAIIDSDHPLIAAHAEKTVNDSNDPVEKAVKLYYAVRDGIWYDPYYPFYLPEQVR